MSPRYPPRGGLLGFEDVRPENGRFAQDALTVATVDQRRDLGAVTGWTRPVLGCAVPFTAGTLGGVERFGQMRRHVGRKLGHG